MLTFLTTAAVMGSSLQSHYSSGNIPYDSRKFLHSISLMWYGIHISTFLIWLGEPVIICHTIVDIRYHSTQLSSAQLNAVQLNSVSTQLQSTQLHSTQLHSTQLHSTQLNSTQFHSTQLHSTQLHTVVNPPIQQIVTRLENN